MATLSRSRSAFRRSRIIDPIDMEEVQSSEDFAWKRKYRQSLADVDLAAQFANYMDPEISKSFLDHNREEFETVLEARPRRSTMQSASSPPLPAFPEDEPMWQNVAISRTRTARSSAVYVKTEDRYNKSEATEQTSRSQRLLRRVKSFVTRRPS